MAPPRIFWSRYGTFVPCKAGITSTSNGYARHTKTAARKIKRDHLCLAGMERGQYPLSDRNTLTIRTKREHHLGPPVNPEPIMSQSTAPESPADADGLEAAADQAIAVCGGDVRAALKAMIVANEFLESEIGELMKAVSRAYVRGRFHTYSG